MIDFHDSTHRFLIQRYTSMLSGLCLALTCNSRILDFGCGDGSLVYAFRDLGMDAYGFDIRGVVRLREEGDRKYFAVLDRRAAEMEDVRVDWKTFRIPFPDEHFDLVVSTEVLEHVQDHDTVLRELARVTKPGGCGIHTFPARWRPIEPHINIPLGGVLKSYPYYLFWTSLGVTNEYHEGRGPGDTAASFLRYAKSSLNYRPVGELMGLAARHFAWQRVAPELWNLSFYLRVPPFRRLARWLYSTTRHVVWVLRKAG
jgi:SAM-dependent methyltransferase